MMCNRNFFAYIVNMPDLDCGNVNDSFNGFVNLLRSIIEDHAPLKRLSRRQQKLQSKPWLTKGIHISIRNRRVMFRPLFLQDNNSEKTFYQKYSNKLNKIIALSKKNHFSSTLDKAKNDPKKTWDLICSVLPVKTDGATSIIDHFEAECDSIEPITVTNSFNNVFCLIGKLTHSNLDDRKFSNYLSNRVSTSLYLNTLSVSEIINTIYSLNVNKAVGHDNIPASLCI